jgi:magnesium-transporting ATPase (P-type)
MSVIVEDETGLNTLICKGAVEEVLSLDRVGLQANAGCDRQSRVRGQG